jgi:hypothetical protein
MRGRLQNPKPLVTRHHELAVLHAPLISQINLLQIRSAQKKCDGQVEGDLTVASCFEITGGGSPV